MLAPLSAKLHDTILGDRPQRVGRDAHTDGPLELWNPDRLPLQVDLELAPGDAGRLLADSALALLQSAPREAVAYGGLLTSDLTHAAHRSSPGSGSLE